MAKDKQPQQIHLGRNILFNETEDHYVFSIPKDLDADQIETSSGGNDNLASSGGWSVVPHSKSGKFRLSLGFNLIKKVPKKK